MSPGVITTATVNDQFQKPANGLQLLSATNKVEDVKLITATEQIKTVVKLLPLLASLVILDLGAGDLLNLDEIVSICDEIFLLLPPTPLSLVKTGQLLSELESLGLSINKPLKLILANYDVEQSQVSIKDIEDKLKRKIDFAIPYAPEIAILAETQKKAITSIQPDSLLSKKYHDIAQYIVNSLQNNQG
jgi:MinD-like ATPase involved in chromosome partitioning or flagellar assembly